jgi:hypothetical protein
MHHWHSQMLQLQNNAKPAMPFTLPETGIPPQASQIFRNPDLVKVLRSLGKYGAIVGSYIDFQGQATVETLQRCHRLLRTSQI